MGINLGSQILFLWHSKKQYACLYCLSAENKNTCFLVITYSVRQRSSWNVSDCFGTWTIREDLCLLSSCVLVIEMVNVSSFKLMFREGTRPQHERAQKYCSILILPRKIGGMQKHYSRLSLTGETAED